MRNAAPIQRGHLLADCPVNRRIAGMQPHDAFPLFFRVRDDINHGFQRHARAVIRGALRLAEAQMRLPYERSGINHDIRALQ